MTVSARRSDPKQAMDLSILCKRDWDDVSLGPQNFKLFVADVSEENRDIGDNLPSTGGSGLRASSSASKRSMAALAEVFDSCSGMVLVVGIESVGGSALTRRCIKSRKKLL